MKKKKSKPKGHAAAPSPRSKLRPKRPKTNRYFSEKNSALFCENVSLDRIAKIHGTPTYVYSAEGFLSPLRALQKGLKSVPHLICFAVKANSNLSVLKLLGEAGAGADLVSAGELQRARMAGIPNERIVFSGVGKTSAEILQALDPGIFSFNVESPAELDVLDQIGKSTGRSVPVSLRLNPDVDAKTHPYIATGLKENKFGLNRRDLLALVKKYSKSKLNTHGIFFKGISIHIGSQILSLAPFEDSFKRVREVIAEIHRLIGCSLEFVDLGGGLGIPYGEESTPTVEQYCALIKKHFGQSGLRILLEPGRWISGNAGALLTQVIYRKKGQPREFVIVDAAMNDLIRPALYQAKHAIIPTAIRGSRARSKRMEVVGPVCETADFLARACPLPSDLKAGEILAILSAGAYGFTMSSQYNSRPRAAEVLVQNGGFRLIRRRETFEDLVAAERDFL